MVIVYCEMCAQRVPEEQLQSGSAVCYADNRYYCKRCAVKIQESARPAAVAVPKTPRPGALRVQRPASAVRKSFDKNWIYIGGSAALILLSAFVFGRTGNSRSETRLADTLPPPPAAMPATPAPVLPAPTIAKTEPVPAPAAVSAPTAQTSSVVAAAPKAAEPAPVDAA